MIQVLDQKTINQIAAGEVVERPSAVVKELMDNSLDAGASAITIEIKEGGISMIRITDNGAGIAKEEIPTPLPRIVKSGNTFGLDPSRLFSLILNPASIAEIVVKIFPVDTLANSCFVIMVVVPAKPLFLRVNNPVTTTSSTSITSSFMTTVQSPFGILR